MTSPAPLQNGAYYHIYNRGNNRETVFLDERNYRHFLQLYAKYVEPVADTYAYCLLPNHFHFLMRIRTEEEIHETLRVSPTLRVLQPSRQFAHLFNAYAKAINRAYGRTGSLFQHPFGRIVVDSQAYLLQLTAYIHQNPQKHGLVSDFRAWTYSSYPALLSTRPTHLKREEVLGWFNGLVGFEAFHRQPIAEPALTPLVLEDD
jgi:REP element-mobilizing transposase RayT